VFDKNYFKEMASTGLKTIPKSISAMALSRTPLGKHSALPRLLAGGIGLTAPPQELHPTLALQALLPSPENQS